MKCTRCLAVLVGLTVLTCFLVSPFEVHAQGSGNAGNNAVYNSSSACCAGSSAFIDANILFQSDICTTIYLILNGTNGKYTPGAVIDARGISGTTALTCPSSTSPWFTQSGGYLSNPSTILLPAATIKIPYSWVLPNGTRLIGEGTTGAGDISANGSPTTIQAASSFSGPMIQFGDSINCPSSNCTDISVEHLILDGNNQTITGILNDNSGVGSYVNHVTFYRILGVGLSVGANSGGGNAQNSGPYSNINYDTGTSGVYGSTCASINGLANTHGIHGLSCKSSADSQAAILLDSSNNSLEDVRIVGFVDGILVGSHAAAHSNVLLNIVGDTAETAGAPVHVVHISTLNSVTDLSVMGVNNVLGGSGGEYSIDDQVTSTMLGDSYVAMYVLGHPSSNGYSRYTTSPSVPTWSVGNNNPPLTSNTCITGSLYSCIGSGCNDALSACVGAAWVGIK